MNKLLKDLCASGLPVRRGHAPALRLSRGEAFSMVFSDCGRPVLYVKASPCAGKLLDEWSRLNAARRRFGGLVPQPIKHGITDDGLAWFATEAVEMLRALPSPRNLLQDLASRPLVALFDVASSADTLPHGEEGGVQVLEHADRLSSTAEELGLPALSRFVAEEPVRTILQRLPPVPQHGDFWVGNIGALSNGAYVVFDWEDYGKSLLPGLDVFSILSSLQNEGGTSVTSANTYVAKIFQDSMLGKHLTLQEFFLLRSVYLLEQKNLRRNYGADANQSLMRKLHECEVRMHSASFVK